MSIARNILDAKELPRGDRSRPRAELLAGPRQARRCRQNEQAPRCSMGACAIFDM